MRALLDTHTFLWWNMDDPHLSLRAREVIMDGHNEIYLSAASAWEIAIKASKGRLILPENPEHYVSKRMASHHFLPMPIQLSHALHIFYLPNLHQDPFDRLLIAQSQLEGIPLLSNDSELSRSDVEVIW
jgi:PIN domain nuclease of toxin-antitoxin system